MVARLQQVSCAVSSAEIANGAPWLRMCYAVSVSDIAFAARMSQGCPALMDPTLTSDGISLRACYDMSGTNIGYARSHMLLTS
eukprot:2570862-Rhodomonas_salina.4